MKEQLLTKIKIIVKRTTFWLLTPFMIFIFGIWLIFSYLMILCGTFGSLLNHEDKNFKEEFDSAKDSLGEIIQ